MQYRILLFFISITLSLNAQFAPLQNINRCELCGIAGVKMVDFNKDGLLDVLAMDRRYGRVAWHENLGEGNFSGQKMLFRFLIHEPKVIDVGDFNQDGHIDIVLGGEGAENRIEIYFNDGTQNFTLSQNIEEEHRRLEYIIVEDIDDDNDLDFITLGENAYWFENDGTGKFIQRGLMIEQFFNTIEGLHTVDIDQDGDMDLTLDVIREEGLKWFENDGTGKFTKGFLTGLPQGRALTFADFNNDNLLDIAFEPNGAGLFTARSMVVMLKNQDSSYTKTLANTGKNLSFLSLKYMKAADFNKDGNVDILWLTVTNLGNAGVFAWQENLGNAVFSEAHVIDATLVDYYDKLYVADLDGDGAIDFLHSRGSKDNGQLSWYKNDGLGNFQHPLSVGKSQIYNPYKVYPSDLDTDGDLDLLLNSSALGTAVWLENDGTGKFSDQQIIGEGIIGVIGSTDINGNDLQDLIVSRGRKLYLQRNVGRLCFSPLRFIADNNAEQVEPSDMDGDGDKDLVVLGSNRINYYENIDGGKFWREVTIEEDDYLKSIHLADINADGRADILIAKEYTSELVYYRNQGSGKFIKVIVTKPDFEGASTIDTGDFDSDGDIDILYSNYDKIGWFENEDNAFFSNLYLLEVNANTWGQALSIDVDGDSDLDIMVAEASNSISMSVSYSNVFWYENDGSGNFKETLLAVEDNAIIYYDTHKLDLDQDSDLDFLFVNLFESQIAWYENLQIDEPKIPQEKPKPELKANIYPNPFSDFLHFDVEDLAEIDGFNILLFNSAGQQIETRTAVRECAFFTKDLPTGVYFYRIESLDGTFVKTGSLLHLGDE